LYTEVNLNTNNERNAVDMDNIERGRAGERREGMSYLQVGLLSTTMAWG
jgi:hypothetical protein